MGILDTGPGHCAGPWSPNRLLLGQRADPDRQKGIGRGQPETWALMSGPFPGSPAGLASPEAGQPRSGSRLRSLLPARVDHEPTSEDIA